MNKKQYLNIINDLKLDKDRYCIISGDVILLYGLKDTIEDIDIKDLERYTTKRFLLAYHI